MQKWCAEKECRDCRRIKKKIKHCMLTIDQNTRRKRASEACTQKARRTKLCRSGVTFLQAGRQKSEKLRETNSSENASATSAEVHRRHKSSKSVEGKKLAVRWCEDP